jgi:hypothetical protein
MVPILFVEGNQTLSGASSVSEPKARFPRNQSSDPEGCTGNNGTTGEWGFSTWQELLRSYGATARFSGQGS